MYTGGADWSVYDVFVMKVGRMCAEGVVVGRDKAEGDVSLQEEAGTGRG